MGWREPTNDLHFHFTEGAALSAGTGKRQQIGINRLESERKAGSIVCAAPFFVESGSTCMVEGNGRVVVNGKEVLPLTAYMPFDLVGDALWRLRLAL